MNILFTICGRAGSKGFKNKNLMKLHGAPLVFYSLAAIKCYMDRNPQNKIYVAMNTDSDLLMELVKSQGYIPVEFIPRKKELAGDIVPKVDVIKDTYLQYSNRDIEVVIDLDITSPYRRVTDIEDIIYEYKQGSYDLVFSVVEARRNPYFNMVEQKEDGFYKKICQSDFTARQQAPKSFELNASVYAYDPNFLKGSIDKTILDYKCGISVMPDYLVLDIDSEGDFELMQYLHQFYCEKDANLNAIYSMALRMNAKRNKDEE